MTQTGKKSKCGGARPATADARGRDAHDRFGRWKVVALADRGTWAEIYRARPADAGDDCPAAYALKTLRPEHQGNPLARALLAREALVGRQVSHPNLIAVLETHVTRDPPFVVLPFLEGATLSQHLSVARVFDLPAVLWIARQTAEALAALEAAGWMHGDVKPSNLFLSPEGHATLLDLGFAHRGGESLSDRGKSLLGTANYLAPECLTHDFEPDLRSDLYSLGAVMYELLGGQPPYQASNLADLALQHRQTPLPRLRQLNPLVPGEVAEMVHCLLAKNPLRRPQTARELVGQLVGLEIATFAERAA